MSKTLLEQLHQQIDQVPDHIVEQITKFTLLISNQQDRIPEYTDW